MDQELLQQQISNQEALVQPPSVPVIELKKKRLLSEKQKEALKIGREKRWKRMFDALEKETGTVPVKSEPDTNGEVQQFLDPNTSSSSSSSESEKDTPPPSPVKELKIRKEKKLPRAVRRRVDRYIKKKLEESIPLQQQQVDEQVYPVTDPYYSQSFVPRVQYL